MSISGIILDAQFLILLIVIVTIYSKIIRAAQNSGEKRKAVKAGNDEKQEENKIVRSVTREEIEDDDGEIPGEVIAVIAAAVDAVYGDKPHKIRSVRKSRPARSAWAKAGMLQNTRPF